MLHILTFDDLDSRPPLRDGMFRDRARQFRDRLGWGVLVDSDGLERDEYDRPGALYLIHEGEAGHEGSARLRPTTGPHMAADHFAHLTGNRPVRHPQVWEVTRFCLAPSAGRHVAARLMLAGAEVMRREGLTHLLGVFDAPMLRVYAALGSRPHVLGQSGGLALGLWSESPRDRSRLLHRAGLSPRGLAALLHSAPLALAA